MENTDTHDHDHDHSHGEEVLEQTVEPGAPEPVMLDNTVEREHAHDHSGIDGLLEVMFGFEHVVAEIFWNTVWLGAAFVIGRVIAFRKVHKYIDDKHGVEHEKNGY